MAKKLAVKLTENFERSLADIEQFLIDAEVPRAYDALLDELLDTVIPNLERFPCMGRSFLSRLPRSVETANALDSLCASLSTLSTDLDSLREYVLSSYLVLYARIDNKIYLLAIKHHRQLSFDFDAHWGVQ